MADPADHIPAHLREALRAEIDPGETLRWCGQPSPVRAFRRMVVLAVLGVISFGGIGVLLVLGARSVWLELHGLEPIIQWTSKGEQPRYTMVWITLGFASLMGVGVLCVACLPWWAAERARRTVFAVTSTRIITLEVNEDRSLVRSLEPGHPLHIQRTDVGGSVGNITLYPHTGQRSGGGIGALSLIGVSEARQVERLIRATFDPPK